MRPIQFYISALLLAILFAQPMQAQDASGSAGVKPNTEADPFVENGQLGHFTWGVDISSGVDMTAHDMTNIHIGAEFGYKCQYLRFLGVGAGIITMMNNSSRCYPIYGMVRTSFSSRPQLCFLELRGGISINNILDATQHTGYYASAGLGVTLAHRRTFSSHVLLRCEVTPAKGSFDDPNLDFNYPMAFACIGLGIAF